MLHKNDIITAKIIDLTHEGLGVAKVDGFPLFIENALVGEQVKILVLKTLSKFGYAKVLEWICKSPDRIDIDELQTNGITPAIQKQIYSSIIPLAHLNYEAQLKFKQHQVQKQLRNFNIEVAPIIRAKQQFAYRNKAQIPVRNYNGQLSTGFFRKNSHTFLPLENFYIQEQDIDNALIIIRNIFRCFAIQPYSENNDTGNLRSIILRRSNSTGEMMLTLVIRQIAIPKIEGIIKEITTAIPKIKSVILNFNPENTNVILGKKEKVLFGEKYLRDNLLGNNLLISSQSFFQVNSKQAATLYKTAIEMAEITKNDIVIDAYTGIGAIALAVARNAKKVYGLEIVSDAIDDARKNAELNEISNVEFILGDAGETMASLVTSGVLPDVMIVDPARKGLSGEFISATLKVMPRKIIYISCNPATQARDLKCFIDKYKITKAQPVDMFPQTHHIENIVVLERD